MKAKLAALLISINMTASSLLGLGSGYDLPIDPAQWSNPDPFFAQVTSEPDIGFDGVTWVDTFKVVTPSPFFGTTTSFTLLYDEDVYFIEAEGYAKSESLTPGANFYETAEVQFVLLDDTGSQISYQGTETPFWLAITDVPQGGWMYFQKYHGWTDSWVDNPSLNNGADRHPGMSHQQSIPPGARAVRVNLGHYLATGTVKYYGLNLEARNISGTLLTPIAVSSTGVSNDTSGWHAFSPGVEDASRELVVRPYDFFHAPAGKDGFVKVENGHFYYGNSGIRARFWGTGVASWRDESISLDDAVAGRSLIDERVERLKRVGVNMVRLHGLDAAPHKIESILDASGDQQTDWDARKVDLLDYFISKCKEAGIYVHLDMNVKAKFRSGDGVADYSDLLEGAKAACFFNGNIITAQKAWMSALLNHVNPYTGIAYKDEPAIAMMEIQNETHLFFTAHLDALPASYKSELEALFGTWLTNNSLTHPDPSKSVSELVAALNATVIAFLKETMELYYQDMENYMVNTLSVQVPIAGSNAPFGEWVPEMELNAQLDYIDRHYYWDHPLGSFDEFGNYHNDSQQTTQDMSKISRQRIKDLPLSISEWSYVWPNEQAMEGPMTVAGVGGFQDWDALLVFGVTGESWSAAIDEPFILDNKPHLLAPFASSSITFLRGDVAPGPELVLNFDNDQTEQNANEEDVSKDIMAVNRVSFALDGSGGTVPSAPLPNGQGFIASSDDQVFVNRDKGILVLYSEKTQAVVGGIGGESLLTGDVTFNCSTPYAQISVTSLDTEGVHNAERMLITAVARAQNSGQVFKMFHSGLQEGGGGSAPILLEPVNATVDILTVRDSPAPVVYAVDWYGRRTAETMPVLDLGGGECRVTLGSKPYYWYEVQMGGTSGSGAGGGNLSGGSSGTPAPTLAAEPFNGSATSNTSGWSGAGWSASGVPYTTTGLSFGSLPVSGGSVGNSVWVDHTVRTLSPAIDIKEKTTFITFLHQFSTDEAGGWSGTSLALNKGLSSSGSFEFNILAYSNSDGSPFSYGYLDDSTPGGADIWDLDALVTGNTYFHLLSAVESGGILSLHIWRYGSPADLPAQMPLITDPAYQGSITTASGDGLLQNVGLYIAGTHAYFDEIRISDTFEGAMAHSLPGYAAWAAGFSTAPDGDENSDGVANLIAYGLGAAATDRVQSELPTIVFGSNLVFSIPSTVKDDVDYEVQVSSDLHPAGWERVAYKDGGASWVEDLGSSIAASTAVTTVGDGVEVAYSGGISKLFFRLKVAEQP